MEYIQKFSLLSLTSKLHVLSLQSFPLDSPRLDRRLDNDLITLARRADVSLQARPTLARTATVEISWKTRPRAACLELGCRDNTTKPNTALGASNCFVVMGTTRRHLVSIHSHRVIGDRNWEQCHGSIPSTDGVLIVWIDEVRLV